MPSPMCIYKIEHGFIKGQNENISAGGKFLETNALDCIEAGGDREGFGVASDYLSFHVS